MRPPRSGGPKDQGQTVTLRVLEELLRNRERNARRTADQSRRSTRNDPVRRTRGRSDSLVMPVRGVSWEELQDSFGDARAGGRQHMGIDIFAPRWTEVVAATSGTLTAITHGERSGRSLWLIGNDGRSYFYAHLQDWAGGIHDGIRVAAGELIGFVGNSGNASGSPTHLHFEIRDNGHPVNPYPVLANAEPTWRPTQVATRGGRSTRAR